MLKYENKRHRDFDQEPCIYNRNWIFFTSGCIGVNTFFVMSFLRHKRLITIREVKGFPLVV